MAKIYDNPATVAEEKAPEETATPDVIEKLTEMCNSMAASIENIRTVISQQDGLVEIIEASDRAEEYIDFVKELKEQTVRLKEQSDTLVYRMGFLSAVLEKVDEPAAKELIHAFCAAIGLN